MIIIVMYIMVKESKVRNFWSRQLYIFLSAAEVSCLTQVQITSYIVNFCLLMDTFVEGGAPKASLLIL